MEEGRGSVCGEVSVWRREEGGCVGDIDRREGEGELNDIYWLTQLYLQCHGHL